MLRDDLLLRAKLAPPRGHRRVLSRPALTTRLREAFDYRLTIVQAGTGYGKSTALAALAETTTPFFWLSLSESDADPQRFLAYLIAACRLHLPHLSDLPLAVLQEVSQSETHAWAQAVDALVNALTDALTTPALLILDDYHFVSASADVLALTERFLTYLPPDLHVIIATRYPLTSPVLTAWRVKGDIFDVSRADLVFTDNEIAALFRDTYAMALTPADVAALSNQTEGWPIALQLVWQGIRSAPRKPADLLSGAESLGALFSYLAHDVLDRQPADLAAFLKDTALLRELTPPACDAVTQSGDGETRLTQLLDKDLFVVGLGERHYRYHHLFHDFLRDQWTSDEAGRCERHARAAVYFREQADYEEAAYHWLAAQRFEEAATDIETASEAALQAGRLATVTAWLDALPPDVVARQPLLQRYMGDVCRMRSRFDEALAWYRSAEQTWRARGDRAGVSRALRGQALVYLDTVRPAEAESLLAEAQRLTDGLDDRETQARLLELLAENKLNLGKPDEAERLRVQASALRDAGPDEDALSVRVKLRTGLLAEAQRILEGWHTAERRDAALGQVHPPRAHRETVLILALIHAFKGNSDDALSLAHEGLKLGEQLDSPFVTAVANIRLAHALQLRAEYERAIQHYQTSIQLGDRLAVRRTRAEALWGLTRAYGALGDMASAQHAAQEGIEIARSAGDVWVGSLVELALGASYVLNGQAAAAFTVLTRALGAFRDCGDSFGRAATRLWLCLAYQQLQQPERFLSAADELFTVCEANGYDFLFTRPTLLGVADARRLVPVLLEARQRRAHVTYVTRLLNELGLGQVELHPGYQLRVQTLGAFRLWRGTEEVDAREWRRDKARQLFQLLLTERGNPLQREEITEKLWAQLSPEAAARDFKVALNALNKALEPTRAADAQSAFIARDGTTYCLRLNADLWHDAAEFEHYADVGLRAVEQRPPNLEVALPALQAALTAYTGDYLPEALYEDWAAAERERLLALYLRAADKLAGGLLERGRYDEVLSTGQLILGRDACWERAYRLMMVAYTRQGSRPQALKLYQRCVAALHTELGVDPSLATKQLYERITEAGEVTTENL